MGSSFSSRKCSFTEFERGTPTVSRKLYDAFINHRGPDVKETVAFALYESLEENECWTFLDDQELQLGDSIPSAIQNAIFSSRVQIAIFSPRYAESSWCLDELLLMLKTKALFIPVFCDVKPSDLRYPDKGVYAPAFAQHEQKWRFSNDRLDQWKAALHSSSLISGYEFSTSNDNVETLCTKIGLAVQQEVGKRFKEHQIGLHVDASTSTSAPVKRSSLLPRDSHPVGIHSKVKDMVRLLEDPGVQVIAVVGMGGSGKTFLLQNVCNAVKSKYDHSIWLSISKSYSVKNLQRGIASHIVKNLERDRVSHIDIMEKILDGKVSEEIAAEQIHDSLRGKKSLVVLDDIWDLSTEYNLIDKLGLPGDKDCKVVVTTRNRQTALNLHAHVYDMKNLSDEDSWRLFCAYAFPGCEGNRPPSPMEEEGQKIVKQCGNLPLAIKTTAASLANTTLLSKWEYKRRQLERVVNPIGDPDPVMEILKLSYDSLPAHLKACFAYLSFFPEDQNIDCEYLISLWIAEGFIPAGEEQWDMAWDCLDQLADLCLLQVWENQAIENPVSEIILSTHCRSHDLLHDLAIHISRENKCAFSVEEASTHTSGGTRWCRILLAKKDIDDNAISQSRPDYLRTLSLSQNWEITSIPANLFTTIRGLRVLDLSSTSISTLPASVGKMILLKVLNLRRTRIRELPECVRHLKSLLFLAIDCSKLPVWISELKWLQYLECPGVDRMPKGISKLASLRTMRSNYLSLSIEENEFMRLEDLADMTELQELRLAAGHEMELKRMEEGILAQLVKMRRLRICNGSREVAHFPENMTAMKHLESLRLQRFAVPSWICELANLRELMLAGCECSDYPELQTMSNLVRLELSHNPRCRELPKAFGKSGGFPHLRFFTIMNFSELEEFPELEEGAMACLEEFYLIGCEKVEKVEGLELLKRLKLFRYVGYRVPKIPKVWETLKEGEIEAIEPELFIRINNSRLTITDMRWR